MKLIDADALKEKLDELEPYIDCDENSTAWIESDEVYNAIDNATPVPNEYMRGYEAAEREYKKPQGGWIPISERLPEENGEYLVTREAYIDRENRNMIFVRDISYFTTNYGLNNGFHKANTVIAWQLLPELYKEGDTE